MIRFFFRKALLFLSSLFLVVTLTFALMQVIPGDPFTQDEALPQEILQAMYRHYGFDQPWYIQYVRYLKGILTFDFGPSFKYQGRLVSQIISDGFPVSLLLGLEALILSLLVGISLGTLAAYKQMGWQDRTAMILAVIGISVPNFILATFLQYLFSMKLNLLPVARWGSFAHSILPALSLAALPTAFIARLTRANMIEVLQQDYILTARSKGLNRRQILFRHTLRNALLPVLTYLGPLTAAVLTGSFAVEKIFGIPGLGQWFVLSIMNRDYTVIMGITVFYSAFLMFAIFLVDLLYCLIDPRIKLREP
jgi:oligopeptide transport system permease protein